MPQVTIPFLKPDYYDKFICVGGACLHNCCNYKWAIYIDKQTYKKYRQVTKPIEFAQRLKKHVKLTTPYQIDSQYGYLEQLTDPVRCPFQDNDGLCIIHKELGSEWLSVTCKVFPRNIAIIKNKLHKQLTIEQSMTCGCEEVVRFFLTQKNGLEFITEEQIINQNQMDALTTIQTGSLNEKALDNLFENYYEIKSISLAILQNRELSFENRFILLGLFSQKLDEWRNLDSETTYQKIQSFVASIDEESFAEAFAETKPNFSKQLIVINNLYQNDKAHHGDIFEFIDEKLEKNLVLENIDSNEIERFTKHYIQYIKNYRSYMKDKEYFLENLFVNELHRLRFPFIDKDSAYNSYRYLTSLYVLYRYMVCYYMGNSQAITEEELTDITVYFGRGIANRTTHLDKIITFLNENQCNSLAEMALLIK